ncbi:MAG: hypothetical protein HZB19_00445 [Chloroflexi bacterium]|nr:hypothetical protein [Chloroflexota bacterium]
MVGVLAVGEVTAGAGLRVIEPHVGLGEEGLNVALEVQLSAAVFEGVGFGSTCFNPGGDQAHAVEFTTVFAGGDGCAVCADLHAQAVTVAFGDVERPAGGHAVVAETLAHLGG